MSLLQIEAGDASPGVQVYEPAPDILGDLVRLKPVNIDLIQLTSRVPGAIAGKLRDAATGEHFNSVTLVPLTIWKGRVMFPPDKSDFTQKPICRSNDGVLPAKYIETPQASSCASCPQSKWSKSAGRNIKPPCQETYTMLVISKDAPIPRYVQFKSTGIKPFTDFITRIETDRVKKKAATGRKPDLFEYFFTLSGQEIIGKSGKYYIPMFTDVSQVADPNTFRPFYDQYVTAAKLEAEVEEEDAAIDVSVDSVINSGTGQVHNAEFVEA